MAYRNFKDREGNTWEVRTRSRSEWSLEPVAGNPGRARDVASPGYEKDPFEMSIEELQRLLDSSKPPKPRNVKSPFSD
jgi:hypothetical protein